MEYKKLSKGMGEAVARRTVLRKKDNDNVETWGDVAERVASGNSLLSDKVTWQEKINLQTYIADAKLLMSGRHLQHGDDTQLKRNMEVFTNCSTATTSFLLFYLLLNGSGVGRSYDDDMCIVDWDYMPNIRMVLDQTHPDFEWGKDESTKEAKQKYLNGDWFTIEDSREGWAKIVEVLETLAYEKIHKNKLIIFDFSKVRAHGTPIGGMQDRPASGPKPTMQAIRNVASIKDSGLKPWEQAMWVDHYLAECVLVGGARRSARMSTKWWEDKDIHKFIDIKRTGLLWSSNNSITVDADFWKQDTKEKKDVFEHVLLAAYNDKTGEPGFINQDKLVENREGMDEYLVGNYVGSNKYKTYESANKLLAHIAKVVLNKKYTQITNPCGEVSLNMLGGYCVIADVVPYHCDTLEDSCEAFRLATRALIRVNTMDSLYNKEVKRTNRIGVGMTGIHEFAWKYFHLGFRDLIDEKKSQKFWDAIKLFSDTVKEEAKVYSLQLGVNIPHTDTTIKPAGTTSKLFGLTEGAHLPSMKEYLRWVQFRKDDPLVEKYIKLGYPSKELKAYHGTIVVGFPTQPEICRLHMGGKLVTAAEATPEQQYKWLMLLEKYWLQDKTGNQISYTLKYNPDKVSFDQFKEMILKYQSQIRCCAVMPQVDVTAYEYQPEEPVTGSEFAKIVEEIKDTEMIEDIDIETLKCSSGSCPL